MEKEKHVNPLQSLNVKSKRCFSKNTSGSDTVPSEVAYWKYINSKEEKLIILMNSFEFLILIQPTHTIRFLLSVSTSIQCPSRPARQIFITSIVHCDWFRYRDPFHACCASYISINSNVFCSQGLFSSHLILMMKGIAFEPCFTSRWLEDCMHLNVMLYKTEKKKIYSTRTRIEPYPEPELEPCDVKCSPFCYNNVLERFREIRERLDDNTFISFCSALVSRDIVSFMFSERFVLGEEDWPTGFILF